MANIVTDPEAIELGHRLCDIVAALRQQVSVSVGIASVRCEAILPGDNAESVVTALIGRADAAMYAAKRRGGNQSQHHRARADSQKS